MMLGKGLLTQFVFCCNSFTHIEYADHNILYTGRHLHKMHIPYVHMLAYVGGLRPDRCILIMPLVHVVCLTLTDRVLELALICNLPICCQTATEKVENLDFSTDATTAMKA